MAGQRPSVPGRERRGPVRVRTEVLAADTHGPYRALSIVAPAIAERARPGQFVEVAVEAQHTVLRRPFSIARAGGRGAPGTIDVVFDAHGPGTAWMAELASGAPIDVLGPLGTHFELPQDGAPCVVVGGGYGVAPLFLLGDDLRAAGCAVHLVVGAATEQRLFNVAEARRTSATATFTTEDGSFGTRGRVTDVLVDVLRRSGAQHVYACGPMGMLRAVAAVCADVGVSSQLAVEEHMACGIGVCWTCVVPTRHRDEAEVRNRRSCIDGPVFDGAEIAWDETRWRDAVPTWLAGDVADRGPGPADAAGLPPPPPAAPRPDADDGGRAASGREPPARRDVGLPSTRHAAPPAAHGARATTTTAAGTGDRNRPVTSRAVPDRPGAGPPQPHASAAAPGREDHRGQPGSTTAAEPTPAEPVPRSPEWEAREQRRLERLRRVEGERARREAEREAMLAEQRAASERRRAEQEAQRLRAREEREAWLREQRGDTSGGGPPTVVVPEPAPVVPEPRDESEPPLFIERDRGDRSSS